MSENLRQNSVILLVDECAETNVFIKNWLESKNVSMRETVDIFDVLDEISDFTMEKCPDVFMLPMSSSADDDFAKIEETIEMFSDLQNVTVTRLLSNGENESVGDYNGQQFAGTEANLNLLFPTLSRTANTGLL